MFDWLQAVIMDHIVQLYPELEGQSTMTARSREILEQYGFRLSEAVNPDTGEVGLMVDNSIAELFDIHSQLDVELEARGLTE